MEEAKDRATLLTIVRNMDPYAKKTTIYVFYDDRKQFDSPIKSKQGEGHAETRFKNKFFPRLLEVIRKERNRNRLKTPVGEPVPVTLEINRTPCDACSADNLSEIVEKNVAASRDPESGVPKIKLIVNASSITKEDWRSFEQSSAKAISAMKEKGIEIRVSTIWNLLETKLKRLAQFEYAGRKYEPWEIEKFKREAPDVQRLIEQAAALLNQRTDRERPPKK